MKLPRKNIFTITVLSLFAVLMVTPEVSAQTGYLTVAPARQIIQVDPGTSKTFEVKFINQGDTPINGIFGVADFVVLEKDGSPQFLDDTEVGLSSRYAASDWVTLPYKSGAIAANDKLSLQIKVSVPSNALPGGRYFGVYFEPSSAVPSATGTDYEAGTGVTTRLAGLVYLRVSGPIKEDASVIRFDTPGFVEYGPASLTTEILNKGNYHIRPEGKIYLVDWLGRTIASSDLEEANVFPDASLVFENELGPKYMVGKYTLKLSASYGEGGQALAATTTFWAFPWRLALLIVLTTIIIILVVVILYRGLKGKQKKLEAQLAEEIKELEELKVKVADKVSPDIRDKK